MDELAGLQQNAPGSNTPLASAMIRKLMAYELLTVYLDITLKMQLTILL